MTNGCHLTIAFVDDDEAVRISLSRLARSYGCTCLTFDSGEALLLAEGIDQADCVVLDVHLSGIDGFETRDRLTARGFSRPVLFITAHPDERSSYWEHQLQGSPCLYKPVEESELFAAINRILVEQ